MARKVSCLQSPSVIATVSLGHRGELAGGLVGLHVPVGRGSSLWKAVSVVPDGIIATGWKSGITHPLSEPDTHTVPPRRTRCSDSTAVLAPTRSKT
jgi:hypothetical protein